VSPPPADRPEPTSVPAGALKLGQQRAGCLRRSARNLPTPPRRERRHALHTSHDDRTTARPDGPTATGSTPRNDIRTTSTSTHRHIRARHRYSPPGRQRHGRPIQNLKQAHATRHRNAVPLRGRRGRGRTSPTHPTESGKNHFGLDRSMTMANHSTAYPPIMYPRTPSSTERSTAHDSPRPAARFSPTGAIQRASRGGHRRSARSAACAVVSRGALSRIKRGG